MRWDQAGKSIINSNVSGDMGLWYESAVCVFVCDGEYLCVRL